MYGNSFSMPQRINGRERERRAFAFTLQLYRSTSSLS
jgi:hypothetical protein